MDLVAALPYPYVPSVDTRLKRSHAAATILSEHFRDSTDEHGGEVQELISGVADDLFWLLNSLPKETLNSEAPTDEDAEILKALDDVKAWRKTQDGRAS
jgi:hypothetical protein